MGSDPLVRWQGRTLPTPSGAVHFDWEGVQAMVSLTGATFLTATINSTYLTAPPPWEEGSSGHTGGGGGGRHLQDASYPKFTVYRVFVDGVATRNVTIFPGLTTVTLASGLPSTIDHNATLWLLTDPVFNTWPNVSCIGCTQALVQMSTDGVFTPVPERARRLLILGDSITAGNAVRHPCVNASEDDHAVSYGAQLCESFSANCTTLAVSSKGLYQNCCDALPVTMKDFVLRTLAQDDRAEKAWDWASFTPDAVIVNLGTNDSGHDDGPAWEAAFTSSYVQLLVNLTTRLSSPSLPIFVGVGPITVKYEAWVLAAMATAAAPPHDVQTHLLNWTGAPLDGCGHPGVLGHDAMYATARPVLAAVLGWE